MNLAQAQQSLKPGRGDRCTYPECIERTLHKTGVCFGHRKTDCKSCGKRTSLNLGIKECADCRRRRNNDAIRTGES